MILLVGLSLSRHRPRCLRGWAGVVVTHRVLIAGLRVCDGDIVFGMVVGPCVFVVIDPRKRAH